MKPTASSSKCFRGMQGLSHAGVQRALGSAHTPQRHQNLGGRAGLAPHLTAGGSHRGYVEAPPAQGGSVDLPVMPPGQRRVLHVDVDSGGAQVLASLLTPEAEVIHAGTVAEARRLLESNVFSLVVLDPAMPDGDARSLLPLLSNTPLLVYSALQPEWRDVRAEFLPKPWTSPRQLWVAISSLLGVPASLAAGD